MSQAAYVAMAWSFTLVAVGLYAVALRARGRRLMRRARATADRSEPLQGRRRVGERS